jgi:hypothetical protein
MQKLILQPMRTKALRILLHFVAWPGIFLLPFFVTYGKINAPVLFGEPGGVIHTASTAFLIAYAYINHYLLVPKLYLHRKFILYAMSVTAAAMVVIWFPNVLHPLDLDVRRSFLPQGVELHRGTHSPGGGFFKLSYNIILFVICTFVSITILQQRQLLEVQKEKLSAELSFLKAQINPHFLFNTLNSIYSLAIRKSDDTPKAIIDLSELMRYILKDSNANAVPIQKELDYIGRYVALQKQRLGNTVQIAYSAPTGTISDEIAPLILMSFVENAFKHGVNPNQDSAITISIFLEDKHLGMLVVNNKVTSINQEETMGIGLKNATSRLQHLYPGKHKLTIDDNRKTFSVNLQIDLND